MEGLSRYKKVNNIRYLCTEAFCQDGDALWFSAMGYNGLYCLKAGRDEAEFIGSFPYERHGEFRLHGKAIKVNLEIFFLPDRSHYVHVYDIHSGRLSAYDVGETGRLGCENGICYGGKIYFIVTEPEITVASIDIYSKEIEKYKLNLGNGKQGISRDMVLLNGGIYFACKGRNQVVEYSCNAGVHQIYQIGSEEQEGYGTLCHDGKAFWLSSRRGLVRWDKDLSNLDFYSVFPHGYGMTIRPSLESDEIVCVDGFSNQYSENEFPFEFSVFLKNNIWFFPRRVNMIVLADIHTGEMKEFHLDNECEDKDSLIDGCRNTHCHYMGGMEDDVLIFMSTKSKKIRIINQQENICEHYLKINKEVDILIYLGHVCQEDKKSYRLNDFLASSMMTGKCHNKDLRIILDKDNVGKVIYTTAREF